MNDLIQTNAVTMSSREIAELVGKRHDHVIRDVRSMVEQMEKDDPEMGHQKNQGVTEVKDERGYTSMFTLDKRMSLILVSGYSVVVRARIIDRWQELEAAIKQPAIDLNDPSFLRTTLLAYTEKVIALEAKVQADAPKVDFVDKYTKAEGNKGVREVVKLLGAKQSEFVDFLRANNIMYRLGEGGRLMPYAHHQHAGRFEVKTGVGNNEHAFQQAMFTPRGVTWIAAEWAKYQAIEHA